MVKPSFLRLSEKACAKEFLGKIESLKASNIKALLIKVDPPYDECMFSITYLAHSYNFDVIAVTHHLHDTLPFALHHAVAANATPESMLAHVRHRLMRRER